MVYRILIAKGENLKWYYEDDVLFQTASIQTLADKERELLNFYNLSRIQPVEVVNFEVTVDSGKEPREEIAIDSYNLVNDGADFVLSFKMLGEYMVYNYSAEFKQEMTNWLTAKQCYNIAFDAVTGITAKNPTNQPLTGYFLLKHDEFMVINKETGSIDFTNEEAIIEMVPTAPSGQIFAEYDLTGQINGVTTTFVMPPNVPIDTPHAVYMNGLRLVDLVDYTMGQSAIATYIILKDAIVPQVGDTLIALIGSQGELGN